MATWLLLLVVAVVASQDFYQTQDDSYDSKTLTLDELRATIRCVNDRGPCNNVTASFRQHYPLIVQEACRRCSKVHKVALCQFYGRVGRELPDELEATRRRHDPDGKYWSGYMASFANEC